MLTRPGAPPGPAWMRNLSDSLSGPDHSSLHDAVSGLLADLQGCWRVGSAFGGLAIGKYAYDGNGAAYGREKEHLSG